MTSRRSPWIEPRWLLAIVAGLVVLAPALVWAHERWVRHEVQPFDREYFRHMSGEVLRYSLLASAAVAGVVAAWYLIVVGLVDRLTPVSAEERARVAQRPWAIRTGLLVTRFLLDGDLDGPRLARAEHLAIIVFARIPALVLALGVAQNWIVMPSFPLHGTLGQVLRVVEGGLAVWVATGRFQRALGITLFAVFGFLCVEYGLAAVDAVPVLGSAFFYLYARELRIGGNKITGRRAAEINSRQIAGIRLSLGVGFFLLGLVNKIYHAELFIGVGDQYPQLIEGARHLIPGLTREAWSFTTALGEMTFGLLLLLGIFDKLTTLALSLIFTNFIFTFGAAEIVHLYPIAGFAVLLFHGAPGTVLDGALFRTHVLFWRRSGHHSSPMIYGAAVVCVAVAAGALLMFTPLLIAIQLLPRLLH